MSFIQWCCERGPKSHVAKEIPVREGRRSREKDNPARSRRFSFHKYFTTFFYQELLFFFIYFFNYFTLSFFYIYFFYPWHLPTPTTHDLHPLPTTFSYTPPNDVWETSAEIPYWRRVTTQIWEVLLIGWIKFPTRHDQSEVLPRSGEGQVISMEFLRSLLHVISRGNQ